jgi:hypothetical protein
MVMVLFHTQILALAPTQGISRTEHCSALRIGAFDNFARRTRVQCNRASGRGVGSWHGGDSWELEGTPPCFFFAYFEAHPGRSQQ